MHPDVNLPQCFIRCLLGRWQQQSGSLTDSPHVQIIMSSNKEAVLSEKKQSAHFGQNILVGYSDVIQTKDFATFEDMLRALQQAWDAQWLRVYSARPEGQSPAT